MALLASDAQLVVLGVVASWLKAPVIVMLQLVMAPFARCGLGPKIIGMLLLDSL